MPPCWLLGVLSVQLFILSYEGDLSFYHLLIYFYLFVNPHPRAFPLSSRKREWERERNIIVREKH